MLGWGSSVGCWSERMLKPETTTRRNNEWTPRDDNTARTPSVTMAARHSSRGEGIFIDPGWFEASATCSVNDTAVKMSKSVATVDGVLLLIVLK